MLKGNPFDHCDQLFPLWSQTVMSQASFQLFQPWMKAKMPLTMQILITTFICRVDRFSYFLIDFKFKTKKLTFNLLLNFGIGNASIVLCKLSCSAVNEIMIKPKHCKLPFITIQPT